MSTFERWAAVGFLTGALVLMGCTSGQRRETEETADEVAEETEEVAGEVAEETQKAADRAEDYVDMETTATIEGVGGSGLAGNADLSFDSGQARVEVELAGVADAAAHTAMIHDGSCAAYGGPVVTLDGFISQGGGLESVTTFDESRLVDGSRYAVVVHGQGGAVVGCGDFGEIDRG
ncbi:MAG: hypothetical protein ABR527_03995 [Gemmatimonadota bacterium]